MSTGRDDHPALPKAGARIGGYVLGEEVGRGGAATVFLATDLKHDRPVALKVLNADTSSALGGDRFKREIDVVAKLHHPHILPLHDSGEVEGLLYYVMPLVTGETLRDRIAREGPLPLPDVRRIMNDVAAALDYAHRHGVVHRDVKPANILLDEEHATVADFGIAHRALADSADQLTTVGMIIGTPTYMSPEQSTGSRDIDARTDIYALACVAFEMLAGVPPFRGPNVTAIVAQHLQAPVPSARDLRAELPSAVDDVLRKALAKDPADRYASAREFSAALGDALTGSRAERSVDAAPIALRAPRRERRVSIAVAFVAVLAALALATAVAMRDTGPPSIAVLPFTNMSDSRDNEYLSDGITEELTGALAQLGRFRVTPRTTAFAYRGRTIDIRRIARELDVRHVLEGSVRRDGNDVRIVATLHDTQRDTTLMSETYERSFQSVLSLQAELAATIAERLQRRLLPADRALMAGRNPTTHEAYEWYLRGRKAFDQRTAPSLMAARSHFERAIELDSNYALAYAGLADTYSILAWSGFTAPAQLLARAGTAARRAVEINPDLAEGHISLSIVNMFANWDWAAAEKESRLAIRLDSTLAAAWFFRTWHRAAAGELDEAAASILRARSIDPLSTVTRARVGSVHLFKREYAQAESAARETLTLQPENPQTAQLLLARVLSLQGRHAEAIDALPPDTIRLGSYESGVAGFVYARAGDTAKAYAAARELASRPYVPPEGMATIYAGLGNADSAIFWLQKAVDTRAVGVLFLHVDPMFDTLRADQRFVRIVRDVGLKSPPDMARGR